MGRSQNARKASTDVTGCKVGSVISRKGRSATPVQKSSTSVSQKFGGRTKKISVANGEQGKVSDRRGSIGLSPIHESPDQNNHESVVSAEKRRNPPPPVHWKDIASSSDASSSMNRDGTSDMIMPSGVSSFLLDCLDTSSPMSSCQTSTDTSLLSPEIFRRADDEAALESSLGEFDKQRVRNSTLLDVSHAVDIDMRQPPNLSSILEDSRKRDETVLEKGSPQTRVNLVAAPFKQPKKIERGRPVKCRKKVTFHESVVRQELQWEDDRSEPNGLKVARQEVSGNAGTGKGLRFLEMSSDLPFMEDLQSNSITLDPEVDDGEISRGEDARTLPCDVCPWPPRFFDFGDSLEKEAFLQKKRGKLQNIFPSKPLPGPDQLKPVNLKFMNSEVHDLSELLEACWIQLLHEGENFFHNSHLKKVSTKEGVFYEDYGKVRQFHGQVFFPLQKDTSPQS